MDNDEGLIKKSESEKQKAEVERKKAIGYYRTLESLLNDDNPQIVRLAKGIKKELTK